MAIREGSQTGTGADDEPLSTDVNPRLGVTTSQFVIIDDKNLTRDEMKDDLYNAVDKGNTVKVGELTGRGPDVKRPEPSGATEIEGETEQNRDRMTFEEKERKRLSGQDNDNGAVTDPKSPDKQLQGVASTENPLGLTTPDAVPRDNAVSLADIDPEEAARRGDYSALLRLRLAAEAREENEHIDVDGDNDVDGGSRPEIMSMLFTENQYGEFVATDDYGGTYSNYGYRYADQSYTNTSGEHFDAKTMSFTGKGGKPLEVDGSVKQMVAEDKTAGADYLEMRSIAQEHLDAEKGNNPSTTPGGKTNVDTKAAKGKAGGGLKTDKEPTSEEAGHIATFGVALKQDDVKHHRPAKKMYQYYPAAQRLEWLLRKEKGEAAKAILADKKKLDAFIKAHQADIKAANDQAAKTDAGKQTPATNGSGSTSQADSEFTAVSEAEALKAFNSQPITVHHPAASGTAATSSGDGIDKAASTTWYKDKDGGYWDEFGGYYDKSGAYWDTDGTYYSADGRFNIDAKGATHWADGSYTDTHGHTVDKDGNYIDFDGTKVKPPAGVDFKQQLIDADAKGEKWQPPAREKPMIAADTKLPTTLLASLPLFLPMMPLPLMVPLPLPNADKTADAKNTVPASTDTKATPVSADVKLTTGSSIATDLKQDTRFNIDTSKFTQAACAVTAAPSTFSALFSGVHDWLMGGKDTTAVKDGPNACTASSTSTLALNTASFKPMSLASTDSTKQATFTPKPGL